MNKLGQSYSAFKLLISAIVALAILAILMSILTGVIPPISEIDPSQAAIDQVRNLENKPGSMTTIGPVTFNENTNLVASTISHNTQLSNEQICMSKGNFENNDDFEFRDSPYHQIVWKGPSKRQTKLMVTCNINVDLLVQSLEDTAYEGWADDCDICEGQGKCCLVGLLTP